MDHPPPDGGRRDGSGDREGRLIRSLLGACLLVALATPAAAQDGGTRAFLDIGAGAARLHGDATVLLEVAAGLRLPAGVRVGGAGYLLPAPVDAGRVALQELELSAGWGGLFAEAGTDAPVGPGRWTARLLVGAGNTDVDEVTTGLRLDSDNFVVIQPDVGAEVRLTSGLRAAVRFSWRWVGGTEGLPGVDTSDLQGPGLHLRLRAGPL